MDVDCVSNGNDSDLFSLVTSATGLPQEPVARELEEILRAAGINKINLTLEDLRSVLANYLQDILIAAKTEAAGAAADPGD